MKIIIPLKNKRFNKTFITTVLLASLSYTPVFVTGAIAAEKPESVTGVKKTIVYVGSYSGEKSTGGIYAFELSSDGKKLIQIQHLNEPTQAGYQIVNQKTLTLYSVDERKNDGRGPVSPPAKVYSFSIDKSSGRLEALNSLEAPGPNPTYLSLDTERNRLFTANHGGFEHIEKVTFKDGKWQSSYDYDDATVIMYNLKSSGELDTIKDLIVLKGHGQDPNQSKQLAGHAQASSHAHSSVVSPDGKYLLVCNKGTDEVLVYAIGDKLKLINSYKFPNVSAPRHLVFSGNKRFYLDLELSNQVASMNFDPKDGGITLVDKVSAVPPGYKGDNEPAEIRLHPNHKFVYVNNRGSDDISWFGIQPNGKLEWKGSVPLARSLHPGVAARSFALSPDAKQLIVADRPENKLKIYSVNETNGNLSMSGDVTIQQPAFVSFASMY